MNDERAPRPRVIQIGGPGCWLMVVLALALAWFLRKFILFLLALGIAAIVLLVALRVGGRALGFRREKCPACGRRMIVRVGTESTRCPGCGMIHVFPDSVPRD